MSRSPFAMVCGVLHGTPWERRTGAGHRVSNFRIRVGSAEWWDCSAWETAREELDGLVDGDVLCVVGSFSTELIEFDNKPRIKRRLNATRIMVLKTPNITARRKAVAPIHDNIDSVDADELPAWVAQQQ